MLIAGNWKMNTDLNTAATLAGEVVEAINKLNGHGVDVAVCTPFISLAQVAGLLEGSLVRLGAQNMHYADKGAFTGEVSAPMLKSVGCQYVILGHSERRQYFGETDQTVNQKIVQALKYELIPIVCIGETLDERERDEVETVVGRQLREGLAGIELNDAHALVLAYEPIWAIGTGRTASPEQAQAVHAFIRKRLQGQYGADIARGIQILYGGSMKPANAADLLAQPDINGGLIGGASLKAADFSELVRLAGKY